VPSSTRLLGKLLLFPPLLVACGELARVRPSHDDAGSPSGTRGPSVPAIALPDAAPVSAAVPVSEPRAPAAGPWGGQYVDPGLPVNVATAFVTTAAVGGPAAPRIVYPLAGSLHPTNITDMNVQWTNPQRLAGRSTEFRLRFQNERGTYDVFAPCTAAECTYAMPEAVWKDIARSNADQDVALTVTGAAGGATFASSAISVRFSAGRVEGGLYYWSTSLKGTYRLTLGQKKAVPFIAPGKGGCFGCHAVSRSGKRIAWTDMSKLETTNTVLGPIQSLTQRLATAVTETPEARADGKDSPSATMSLNPDGSRVLVADGANLVLRDAATAAVIITVDPAFLGSRRGVGGFFPEWSPDGKSIALTLGEGVPVPGTLTAGFNVVDAEIAVMPYNDGQFGPARVVVPLDREMHFYPTWSPDGRWLVFCSAPSTGITTLSGSTANTYDNRQARLRLVAATGGRVYELGRATGGPGTTASWPKFTPFSQLGGQLLFVAFSSKADYGFLKRDADIPQLWMAAIDLRRLSGLAPDSDPSIEPSIDPSWAPVWLPFQEVDQNNHLPFWTEALGCVEDKECGPGATCRARACIVTSID
jgi:hypothetical protein